MKALNLENTCAIQRCQNKMYVHWFYKSKLNYHYFSPDPMSCSKKLTCLADDLTGIITICRIKRTLTDLPLVLVCHICRGILEFVTIYCVEVNEMKSIKLELKVYMGFFADYSLSSITRYTCLYLLRIIICFWIIKISPQASRAWLPHSDLIACLSEGQWICFILQFCFLLKGIF